MEVRARFLLVAVANLFACVGAYRATAADYDLIVRNGHVIDGTGSPWYAADVAVKDGRIVAIGRLGDAKSDKVIHLGDRGAIKQGLWADLVVFDPATIHDVATYEDPNHLSAGMAYVLVNGVPVIEQGKMTGKLPGKVLRGPGYTGQ